MILDFRGAIVDQAIDELEGLRTVADVISVTGNGARLEEASIDHNLKIKKLLERCRAKQIKLNSSKIETQARTYQCPRLAIFLLLMA